MSPWGGYGKPKQQRVAAGRSAGYEIVDNGFALSGPKYYAAFRDTCVKFVRDYGVNQFKFDGTGNADRVFPGSEFDSDFAAAIHLIGELRALKPDLYINLTTGTYPSPFWLRYADSIWRGGEDHDFLGVGPRREQWITYRDADTYEHIVLSGPLVPAELADAARNHLCAPREGPGYRSAGRLQERSARLLRQRNAVAGDVRDAVAALERRLGQSGGSGKMVARERRRAGGYALDRRRSRTVGGVWLGVVDSAQGDSGAAKPG